MQSINLILGDALIKLHELDSNSVDVCVTSPPYNLGGDFHSSSVNDNLRRSYGGYGHYEDNLPESEYQANQIEVLTELHRIIKPTGWLFYVHKNRIRDGRVISPFFWLLQTPWIVYQDVVIDMAGTTNVDKRRFFPAHEFVFILASQPGLQLNNANCLTSIWKFPQINRADVQHPATFHPHLPRICLEAATTSQSWVIDPYMGVGTTGLAALQLNMNFIGIEVNQEYFNQARHNLETAQNRPRQLWLT